MEHTPSIPKAPKCKEFLHKLLLGGLAYVPGASCGKPESLRGIQGDPLLRHGFCPGMVICKVWGLLDNHCENLDGKNDLYFVLSHAIEGSYYAIQMQHVVFYLEMQLESFPKSMPRNSLWDIKEVFKNHPERTGFSYLFFIHLTAIRCWLRTADYRLFFFEHCSLWILDWNKTRDLGK